ncbi:MAG: UDP-N-acetylmuramate--L-alanine ligase [Armatimonadota bacterium]|nr:UDP-N-acetylmuramate--L-alanine ligase [Armatimonadota bacterium]MDR7422498.1 UDP-N-acetylmuramate--L-alanine ligase [Armatimonadota bacterium]MDR7458126.1 UDP-N-acetylmuramate--L-alanine ligase [Armatimonadota bacterium]MDR7495636.1 UDP-N-acetylmuramate--L-alanine ligase [Armatimonadota bacterium]
MIRPEVRAHFVGIGGAGMSAIAEVLLRRGYAVSGCDVRDGPAVARLRRLGAPVALGHSADHLAGSDLLVVSRAVADETEEIRAARAAGMPVRHRAEVLAEIMRGGRSIAVVGTHGKTTTTAMLARVLAAAGLDPTALIGAYVPEFDSNALVGAGPWIVAEVDESDGSLLHVAPTGVVLTSLDVTDHRDFYASATQLGDTFGRFLRAAASDGFVVACADDPGARETAGAFGRLAVTYGFDPQAAVRGEVRALRGRCAQARVYLDGRPAAELALQVPGRHNVSNALGAIAAALQVGVPLSTAVDALAGFQGASRRFEVHGEVGGVMVVDDYAHNPVKVSAVLRAAREGWPQRRVIALFQPHRFSRTRTTFAQFARAFDAADEVVITEIYAADEPVQPGVSARLIVDAVAAHRRVHYRPTMEEAIALVETLATPAAIVLTLGAGDVGRAADLLLRRLGDRTPGAGSGARVGGAP